MKIRYRLSAIFIVSGLSLLAAGCSYSATCLRTDHELRTLEKFPFRFRIARFTLTQIEADGTSRKIERKDTFVHQAFERFPERYPQFFTASEENSIPVSVDWKENGVRRDHNVGLSLITLGLVPYKRTYEYTHHVHLKILSVETNTEFKVSTEVVSSLGILGTVLQTYRWSGFPSDYIRDRDDENFFESGRLDPFILDAFASFERDALIELYNSKYVKPTQLLE